MHVFSPSIRPFWIRSLAPAALGVAAVVLVSMRLGAFTVPEPDAPPVISPVDEPHADRAEAEDTLELELAITEASPSCVYYSVWDEDGVVAIASELTEAEFERKFDFMDGCQWRSRERLIKVAPGRYRYTYTEAPEQCPRGATAAGACTRSGFAVVQSGDDGER